MASKIVKGILAAALNTVTEYVLKDGKKGIYSHSNVAHVESVRNKKIREAVDSGKDVPDLKIHKRHVKFDDHTTVPTGEDSRGAQGTVTETLHS